ncbi:hypothetical protein TNCV_1690721 [Trichonephila clavipes]|nr:hypothetical protein TNCV_1690721 [Trichonephila clavipes]
MDPIPLNNRNHLQYGISPSNFESVSFRNFRVDEKGVDEGRVSCCVQMSLMDSGVGVEVNLGRVAIDIHESRFSSVRRRVDLSF